MTIVSHAEAIKLVYAVSTADNYTLPALDIKNITVYGEQDIREVLLIQHTAAVPLLFPIGADMLRSVLVIAMDAEKGGFHITQFLLQQPIIHLPGIIDAHIAKQYNDILPCWLKPFHQIIQRLC